MDSWAVRPVADVSPLKLAMQELASRNGKVPTKTTLALAIKGDGTLWRATECVERLIAAGYAHTVIVRGNEGRTQRFELHMTDEGWAAARRMGIERW